MSGSLTSRRTGLLTSVFLPAGGIAGNSAARGAGMSNFLVMAWLLSLGFVPASSLETTKGSINASGYLTQNFGVGFYLANHLRIYSNVELRETKSGDIYFDPFRGDFLIGGEVYFGALSLGVSHECNHDIVTNMQFHDYNGWEAVFEKVYINYFLPVRIRPEITIRPSVRLTDRFTEKVRVKSSDRNRYFDRIGIDVSPNILSPEFRLEVDCFFLRAGIAFEAGYAPHDRAWAYTRFRLGTELLYKNISLGLEYTNRRDTQEDAGCSLEKLELFVRFRGKTGLL